MIGWGRKPDFRYCSDPHIHMAMVKTGTNRVIDPTGYLRKRKMPPPEWIQECDHYVFVWKVGSAKLSSTTLSPTMEQQSRLPNKSYCIVISFHVLLSAAFWRFYS